MWGRAERRPVNDSKLSPAPALLYVSHSPPVWAWLSWQPHALRLSSTSTWWLEIAFLLSVQGAWTESEWVGGRGLAWENRALQAALPIPSTYWGDALRQSGSHSAPVKVGGIIFQLTWANYISPNLHQSSDPSPDIAATQRTDVFN